MELQTMYPAAATILVQLTEDLAPAAEDIPVTDASVFPAAPNFASIGTDNNTEVVVYQGIDLGNNKLTGCQRGQSFTLARSWTVGALVYHSWTAQQANAMAENIRELGELMRPPQTVGLTPTEGYVASPYFQSNCSKDRLGRVLVHVGIMTADGDDRQMVEEHIASIPSGFLPQEPVIAAGTALDRYAANAYPCVIVVSANGNVATWVYGNQKANTIYGELSFDTVPGVANP